MPFVNITLIEGRTDEQKEQLIYEVSQTVSDVLNASIESVRVCLNEVPSKHWGIAGESVYKRNNK